MLLPPRAPVLILLQPIDRPAFEVEIEDVWKSEGVTVTHAIYETVFRHLYGLPVFDEESITDPTDWKRIYDAAIGFGLP